MAGRMPVLCQDDMLEFSCEAVDDADDLITMRNRQGSAGTEIVLNVGNEEEIARENFYEVCHESFGVARSSMLYR